ncbi:MAG: universal stress protein, partial [Alphaproteobacteria bacterium]
VLYVREGKVREQLVKVIEEEPGISVLVLGASTGPDGPGPLVTSLAGKMAGRFRIPITIVPGGLGDDEVETLA